MFKFRIQLIFLGLFFSNILLSQNHYPGGISTNLNMWLKSNSTSLLKFNVSTSSPEEYVYDWKFTNDNSKTYIPISIANSPLYYNLDTNRILNKYESVSFFSDSVNRYNFTSSVTLNNTITKSLYFFIVSSNSQFINSGRNPLFSTTFLPNSNNQVELNIADQNGNIGWKHGLTVDTFYRPMPTGVELNKPNLWTFQMEVDSLTESISRNGKVIAQKSNPNTLSLNTNLYGNLGFSKMNTGSENYGNFNLGEIVIYQGVLSAIQKQKIQSYLAFKYGLPLYSQNGTSLDYIASDGTTKMWDKSMATLYPYHIAGIGIDTLSQLYQKQNQHAYSGNKGNLIQMGFDTILFSNTLNPYNFGQDKNNVFYTWSDNNDTVSKTQSIDLPNTILDSACVSRMPREWMIQRTLKDTNAVNSRKTFVSFDLNNTIDFSLKSIYNFQLMIDEDGDGDFQTGNFRLIAPSSFQNNILTFDNVSWDTDKNGKDVFTILYDLNIIKPKLNVKDTLFKVVNENTSIFEIFNTLDTFSNTYYFYNESGNLIFTSGQGNFLINGNAKYYVSAENKLSKCSTTLDSSVVYFRHLISTYKSVIDADSNHIVLPNEELTYTIYVVNIDTVFNSTMNNIKVKDTIPASTNYVPNSASANGVYANGIVTFTFTNANLKPLDTLEIKPSFKVETNPNLDTVIFIKNTAFVEYLDSFSNVLYTFKAGCNPNDPNSICDAEGNSIIYTTRRYANIEIVKEVLPSSKLKKDGEISYRIKVKNNGPYTAKNILVTDTLSTLLSNPISLQSTVPISIFNTVNRDISWTIDSLVNNQEEEMNYTCTIITGPTIKNQAFIFSSNPDTITANNSMTTISYLTEGPIDEAEVTNVITPNNDGFNDKFVIPGILNYPGSTLTIFNRWGSEIYKSDDYKNDWDASSFNEGTYYYVLVVNSTPNQQVIKKWIQVIKSK